MIDVGQPAPQFTAEALVGREFKSIKLSEYKGKWVCLYFYPLDFTFVCPTEIAEFSRLTPEFEKRNCVVLGGSCDSKYSHLGWVQAKKEIGDLKHPLIADYTKDIAKAYGILDDKKGVSKRAAFLIDPEGIIRFVYVTDLSVGRNPQEVLRVLDALDTGELCPVSWSKGQPTLK